MTKIDAFAHILTPNYYQAILKIAPQVSKQYPFGKIKSLVDLDYRLKHWDNPKVKQVLSFANLNAEDYAEPDKSLYLCRKANSELNKVVIEHPQYFAAGVGMLSMNNVTGACQVLEAIAASSNLIGAQIFTRHLGKSIASKEFEPIFAKAKRLDLPLWLHPVFDTRKPDNNLVFSWEYELSQAMLQLVQKQIFEKYPHLKIIVHHAGAMVPYFDGRIRHILSTQQAADFKKFYVDTAVLDNPGAIRLAITYYGVDHVLFGTDAPFAVMPSGATNLIIQAINQIGLSIDNLRKIYADNLEKIVNHNLI